MRSVILLSLIIIGVSSCTKPEYSSDEPLIPELRPAVYATSQNNVLFALDPKSGKHIWELDFGTNTIVQEPVLVNGFALVNTNLGIVRLDADKGTAIDTVSKLDIKGENKPDDIKNLNGAISAIGDLCYTSVDGGNIVAYNYTNQTLAWVRNFGGNELVSSAGSFYNSIYYFVSDSKVLALNQASGDLVWSSDLGTTLTNQTISLPQDDGQTLSLAPTLYVCATDGTLYSINLLDGTTNWSYMAGGALTTSPIAYGENIIFGTEDKNLYCIDPIAQQPRWVFNTDERIRGSAYAYDQTIYFGSFDHYFYALDVIDGTLKWRYRTGAVINSSPIVYDNLIYIGGYDKMLYAFDTTGRIQWQHNVNGPVIIPPVAYDLERAYYPAESGLATQ